MCAFGFCDPPGRSEYFTEWSLPVIRRRPASNPFDVRDGRAMVSLGPLSDKRFCTYNCPFCYVHSDFLSFGSLNVPQIVEWLSECRELYDIVYISGDTDSFAPPRTNAGLELIESIIKLDVDVLFTTRAIFSPEQLSQLADLAAVQAKKGRLLFGCVSVAQLSFPHLEPKPIPPATRRIEQLAAFKSIGLVSVLAMRPFLPIVPVTEYLEILRLAQSGIHFVLGEVWYADPGGLLERGVFRGPTPDTSIFTSGYMTFDTNTSPWRVFEARDIEAVVADFCRTNGVPFFMRSRPGIEWARAALGPSTLTVKQQ